MDAKEKRRVETELVRMGLAGLSADGAPSGELVQQLAAIVNSWQTAPTRLGEYIDKHKFLRDLLNECEPAERSAMYDAIKPHLTFKVHPLSHYESMIALKAGEMVSQHRMRVEGERPQPITVGGNKYVVASKARATNVVATFTCYRCRRFDKFVAETPVGAMTEGRKAGWTREKGVNKEICPACTIALAESITRLTDARGKPFLEIHDKRAVKLDA